MAMGVCGYIEWDGVKYWKPNMAALPGDIGQEIIEEILSAPKPDEEEMARRCAEVYERIRKAKENGTF